MTIWFSAGGVGRFLIIEWVESTTFSSRAHFGRMLHNITHDAYNTVPHEPRPEDKLRQEVASQVIDTKEVLETIETDSKYGAPTNARLFATSFC